MEMRAVYAECLAELMERDKHVCVLDADLSKASGTRKLYENIRPVALLPIGYAADGIQPAPLHTAYREYADTITEL